MYGRISTSEIHSYAFLTFSSDVFIFYFNMTLISTSLLDVLIHYLEPPMNVGMGLYSLQSVSITLSRRMNYGSQSFSVPYVHTLHHNFTVLEIGCVSLTLDPWVYPISPGKLFRSKVTENY